MTGEKDRRITWRSTGRVNGRITGRRTGRIPGRMSERTTGSTIWGIAMIESLIESCQSCLQ
jgi:hypothetical protein